MSGILADHTLTVSWSLPDPPVDAVTWKQWTSDLLLVEEPLERDLGWPQGTLAVLGQAFREGLPRGTGWDLKAIEHSSAYTQAARIFRRGVAVRPSDPRPQTGHYPLSLSSHWDWGRILPKGSLGIIDQHVAEAWKLQDGPQLLVAQFDELSKNLKSVAQLIQAANAKCLSAQLNGPWSIIGGGVLADTTAFAAALASREFRLVPTTLLAMLDACVGGKTGVNFPPFGKNQLGLFAFPSEVLILTPWLKTLPQREYLSGLSEAFKHAVLIGDSILAASVAQLDQRPDDLPLHLRRLVQLKADIVAQDPSEKGLRAALNLGHTLAHALERVSHARCPTHPLLHGEAVGLGLSFCLALSHELGHLSTASFQEMQTVLHRSRIIMKPQQLCQFLRYDDLEDDELIHELMLGIRQDKKARTQHNSEWVLLADWGRVVEQAGRFTVTVTDEQVVSSYRKWVRQWQKLS
jgi:3-dehydroquinate synthetase